jgi:glutathione S-transferase
MKILGRTSSINVRKVLWTADELGLAYERQEVETASPAFRALNPNGLVPVLIDDHGPLWESNAICRYMAAGSALFAVDARARAVVDQWMEWQATELNTAWRFAFAGLVRRFPGFEDETRIAASVRDWNAAMGVLEQQLQGTGAFVTGETFTLADVVIGLSVHRWLTSPIDRADLPAVAAYYARLRERPAFLPYAREDVP